jgi:hypothetical protein
VRKTAVCFALRKLTLSKASYEWNCIDNPVFQFLLIANLQSYFFRLRDYFLLRNKLLLLALLGIIAPVFDTFSGIQWAADGEKEGGG